MIDKDFYKYVLGLGDDSLIIGQRLSEWAYKGPFLEEDMALSNIALDMFGRANLFLEYASEINGKKSTADDLAFKRNEREFSNLLICEQPNGNFADTMVRQLFIDVFNKYFLEELINSSDTQLSAIAKKSSKETAYHLRHSEKWVVRLGDGTEESNKKIQNAINELWIFTAEFFEDNKYENKLVQKKIAVDRQAIKIKWKNKIDKVFEESKVKIPDTNHKVIGGRDGVHTEHLGHILADMQYLQRSYPDAIW
tara:strand:+ start:138 stop:893 length:756 start_codon:yes stop_codon:yes gene_type:complete